MIEIIEFYPIEKNDTNNYLSGTLRIRLLDLGFDILGIYVVRNTKGFFVNLPRGRGVHHETGLPCWYPFLSFQDREKQKQLMQEIKVKGEAFIEARLADKENPLIFPGKSSFSKRQASPLKTKEVAKEAKETAAISKPKSIVWSDPPKRIQTAHKMRTGRKF